MSYYDNKSCGCNCECNYDVKPDPCLADCSKYTEISNCKCEEASEKNNEANQVAIMASSAERKAEELQAAANNAACEALRLWRRYNEISEQSSQLLREAQKALEESIKCQKKCMANLIDNNKPCCCDCKPNYPKGEY